MPSLSTSWLNLQAILCVGDHLPLVRGGSIYTRSFGIAWASGTRLVVESCLAYRVVLVCLDTCCLYHLCCFDELWV